MIDENPCIYLSGGDRNRTCQQVEPKFLEVLGLRQNDDSRSANALHIADSNLLSLSELVVSDERLLEVVNKWNRLPDHIKLAIEKLVC